MFRKLFFLSRIRELENYSHTPELECIGIIESFLLGKNLGFHPTFSRHGIAQASLALLIWLNENVLKSSSIQ